MSWSMQPISQPRGDRPPTFASSVEQAWGCLEDPKLVRRRALLQVYKQKVKHLLYEQQQIVAQLRIEAEAQLEQATSEAAAREQSLVADKQSLQRQLNEQVRNSSHDGHLSSERLYVWQECAF